MFILPSIRGRFIVNALRTLWTVISLWYELGIFTHSVQNCRWPDPSPRLSGSTTLRDPVLSHVLIVADPQILDHRSYPGRPAYLTYLSQLVVDLNIRKSWRAARRKNPDAVVFLGDMMDGGRFSMTDDEYEQYYRRFKSIFTLNPSIPQYFLPGNHDTGLRASLSFSPQADARYISHFGQLNSFVSIANHSIVFLDAPSLVEQDYQGAGPTAQWKPLPDGPVEFVNSFAKEAGSDPIVLFSHIPLARSSGISCGPHRERGTIRPGTGFGYQNTLSQSVTDFLLQTIRPSVIFSGDDHDYCEHTHTAALPRGAIRIREVTVKSLSMAMGIRRPGFQLLSLAPHESRIGVTTYADSLCLLPDQLGIYLSTYIPLLATSLLVVLIANVVRSRSLHSPRPPNSATHSRLTGISIRTQPEPEGHSLDEAFNHSDEVESYDSYSLPVPASAPRPSLFDSCRRFEFGAGPARATLLRCLNPFGPRKRRYRGLLVGFFCDVRDVAVFPVGIFILASWWTFVY